MCEDIEERGRIYVRRGGGGGVKMRKEGVDTLDGRRGVVVVRGGEEGRLGGGGLLNYLIHKIRFHVAKLFIKFPASNYLIYPPLASVATTCRR